MSNSAVPAELLLTSCNRYVDTHVDGPALFAAVGAAVADAQHEVDLAFYKWDPASDGARLLGEAFIAAAANREGNPLLVRILVSDNTLPLSGRTIDDLYDSTKAWGLANSDDVVIQLATYPYVGQGTMHDKLVVVDGRTLFVTGANPQTDHDDKPTRWHDSGHRVDGDSALAALAHFDSAWDGQAKHWKCSPRRFRKDCRGTTHAAPERDWLDGVAPVDTTMPVMAVGRPSDGSLTTNSTDNPQDLAWLATLDNAQRNVFIESPNINDDAFRNAVVGAAARGIDVRIITSKEFNDITENLPGQGGHNRTAIGKLRTALRARAPAASANLQVCWYGRDGLHPVEGKDANASHVKYMSADGQLAIVGSGNQDTQSWNHSREFNVVIDSADAVRRMESVLFGPDLASSVCSVVELYEGNDATQDLTCSESVLVDRAIDLGLGTNCVDDEARSLVVYNAPAGRVVRVFDSPHGDTQDDWMEVVVLRDLREKVVGTFERSFEDADVRAVYHRNNGLDGKVSRLEIGSTPSGPALDLYEGNDASQNLVCHLNAQVGQTTRFPGHASCDNDEARSLAGSDMPAGTVVRLYDDPDGAREDDWLEIVWKRTAARVVLGSFETSLENDDVRVSYFRNNGLDGKVSRLEVADVSSVRSFAAFYEGGNGSQNKVCELDMVDGKVRFKSHAQCDNDEARSMVLSSVRAGTQIDVHDDPNCGTGDDWTRIDVRRDLATFVVASFESSSDGADASIVHHHDNGLNGKVSCVRIDAP